MSATVPSGTRTPGTPGGCEYAFCREPGAGEARYHNQAERGPWAMCGEHLKPEHHPVAESGKLVRWQ